MLKQIMRNIENGYTDYDDWSDDYEIIIDNKINKNYGKMLKNKP